jgi:hypothetical protein
MAFIKGKAKQTTSIDHVVEGADQFIRMLRDGSVVNMPWVMAKAIEGKVYSVHSGIMTAPVAGTDSSSGATAAKPDLLITVPDRTTIIPVYISIDFEDTGTAAVVDVFAVASDVYDNAVTATALTINNLRMDKPIGGSQCTAYGVVTAGGTDPETSGYNFVEFWRPWAGFIEDGFNSSTSWAIPYPHGVQWSIGQAVVPPVIVGTGSLNIYATTQNPVAFITAIWIEEETSNLT